VRIILKQIVRRTRHLAKEHVPGWATVNISGRTLLFIFVQNGDVWSM
jgi:hypothetical protein